MAWTKKIISSSNNVPTSFDETAGSKLTGIPASSRFMVLNYVEEILAISIGEFSAAPSSSLATNPNQLIVPAAVGDAPGYLVCDEILIGNNSTAYVRSEGSAGSTGSVYISGWVK